MRAIGPFAQARARENAHGRGRRGRGTRSLQQYVHAMRPDTDLLTHRLLPSAPLARFSSCHCCHSGLMGTRCRGVATASGEASVWERALPRPLELVPGLRAGAAALPPRQPAAWLVLEPNPSRQGPTGPSCFLHPGLAHRNPLPLSSLLPRPSVRSRNFSSSERKEESFPPVRRPIGVAVCDFRDG